MKFTNLFTFLLSFLWVRVWKRKQHYERRPNESESMRSGKCFSVRSRLPPNPKNNIVTATMVVVEGKCELSEIVTEDEKWIFHFFEGLYGDICGINIYLWVAVRATFTLFYVASRVIIFFSCLSPSSHCFCLDCLSTLEA